MDEKPDHAGVAAPLPLLMVLYIATGFLAEHAQHFQFFPAITRSADLFVSRCSALQSLFLSPPFEN
jgi:hypothetical protein